MLLAIYLRAVCPPTDGDPLSYHITVAIRYLNAHRFVYLPTLTYTNWPVGEQMLFALLLGLHRESPVAIVQFLFGILGFGVVYLFGRRLGGPFTGTLAVVLLMAYDNYLTQMCMAYIDVGLTTFTLLATYALYRSLSFAAPDRNSSASDAAPKPEIREPDPERNSSEQSRWQMLAAIFAGLAVTTKLTGLWTIASLLALSLLIYRRTGYKPILPSLLKFAVVAGLVATPWFIKTWVLTGNPIYPMLYRVFGGAEWTPEGLNKFTFGHMIWNTPPGMQPTPQVLFYSHLFNCVVGGALCLIVLWRTRRSEVAIPVGMAALFTFCICFANYFHPRFLMPIIPLACVGIAYMFRFREKWLALPAGAVAVLLTLSLNARLQPHLTAAWPVATGQISRQDYLRAKMPDYPVTEYANAHIPSNTRILIGTYANNLAYYDAEALWPEWWEQDSIHYETQERLEADLRRLGVDYLVLDPTFPDWCDRSHSCRERKEREPQALEELVRRRGEKLFEARGHTLYRLVWTKPHP